MILIRIPTYLWNHGSGIARIILWFDNIHFTGESIQSVVQATESTTTSSFLSSIVSCCEAKSGCSVCVGVNSSQRLSHGSSARFNNINSGSTLLGAPALRLWSHQLSTNEWALALVRGALCSPLKLETTSGISSSEECGWWPGFLINEMQFS